MVRASEERGKRAMSNREQDFDAQFIITVAKRPNQFSRPFVGRFQRREEQGVFKSCNQRPISFQRSNARLRDLDAPHKGAAKGYMTPQCGGGETVNKSQPNWCAHSGRANQEHTIERCHGASFTINDRLRRNPGVHPRICPLGLRRP